MSQKIPMTNQQQKELVRQQENQKAVANAHKLLDNAIAMGHCQVTFWVDKPGVIKGYPELKHTVALGGTDPLLDELATFSQLRLMKKEDEALGLPSNIREVPASEFDKS